MADSRASRILKMALENEIIFEIPTCSTNAEIANNVNSDAKEITEHDITFNEPVPRLDTSVIFPSNDEIVSHDALVYIPNLDKHLKGNTENPKKFSEQENTKDQPGPNSEVIVIIPNNNGSQDEDPDYVPTADEQEEPELEKSTEINRRRRQKRRHVDETNWSANKNKRKRERGEEYQGRRKDDGRWVYTIPKNERKIKERCKCKLGKNNSKLQCTKFSEENRAKLFKDFWKMSDGEKKVYVKMLITQEEIKRPRDRKEDEKSRRSYSFSYHLQLKETKLRVCKNMFLNTLSIGESAAISWKKKNNQDEDQLPHLTGDLLGEAETGRRFSRLAIFEERKRNLCLFFESLPKMESHYCRARTTKLYLEPLWTSKSQVYRLYTNSWCLEKNIEPLSLTLFLTTFDDMNLSIFAPKKDECSICVAQKVGNFDEAEYQLHQKKKVEARDEKEQDKKNEEDKVYTMDLQSVLLCPKSTVSLLYYKMKLVVHNFTIFNVKTKDGYCFIWNETEGGVGSNEFASILSAFITEECKDIGLNERLIFYSDGCCGQNRNTSLSNALLKLAVEKKVTICQKFLEKGHTQMEADSMHATIERKLKNKKINVPADYVEVCLTARQNPKPYSVKYLSHDFFNDFSNLRYVNAIRPGKKVGDPTVQDIRALRYNPGGSIDYKLRHPDEWKILPVRMNTSVNTEVSKLYSERLKIKKQKYDHLQEIKTSLDKDYQSYYDALPHD